MARTCWSGVGLALGAVLFSGCASEDEPVAVGTFSEFAQALEQMAAQALKTAAPLLKGEGVPEDESYRDALRRHQAVERALVNTLAKAEALLKRSDLDGVSRHPRGRELYQGFMEQYEKVADACAAFRESFTEFFDSLDLEGGRELGLGNDEENVRAGAERQSDAASQRIYASLARFVEARLRQARLLRVAGENAAAKTAAEAAKALIDRHELADLEEFDPLVAEAATIIGLE